jgi:tetratricopeptide (TPR) repeat protein
MKKLIIILLLLPALSFAQKEARLIREGNKSYKQGEFKDAEINYRKSLELNKASVKGEFNLGDALYELKDYESSQQQFEALTKKIEDPLQRAEAFHNLGNSFLAADKYQESIDAFKNALRNNPTDIDTKYNLEYARQKLNEQQKQDQQDKDQDKEQDKKDQEDKQDKKNQEDKKDQEDNQDQQDQEKNQDQNQDEKQQKNQQQQPKQISKQDAERMLEALKNDEKKTIEKLKKAKAKSAKATKTEKDW